MNFLFNKTDNRICYYNLQLMETESLVAALDNFSTSFKYTASAKYNVDFTNNNINDNILKLN